MKTLMMHNCFFAMIVREVGDGAVFKNCLVILFLAQMEK